MTIENCERITTVAVSKLIRVSNCLDSIIYMYSPLRPIVGGDSRGVWFAPFNCTYEGLEKQLRAVGFAPGAKDNMYAMPIDLNFVEPAENRLLSPEKFEPIYVPSVPGEFESGRRRVAY